MISSDLYTQIVQYIEATISKMQLEDWFVARLPAFLRFPDSEEADVISAIELGLAEMGAGIRTEADFRTYLKKLLQQQQTIFVLLQAENFPVVDSQSSNQTDNPKLQFTLNPLLSLT